MNWALVIIVALIVLLVIFPKKRVKVYGSMNCGWTKRQLDYLGSRSEFIDCEKQNCPSWVTGYPGVETADGKKLVGFNKV